MKKIVVIMLALLLTLTLVACGGASIEGKWNPEGVEGLTEALMEITDTDMIILGAPIPYTIDGNQIVITGESGEERIDFALDGDKLTFSVEDEVQVFIRVEE